jgi:hypothetical protein
MFGTKQDMSHACRDQFRNSVVEPYRDWYVERDLK